MMGSNEIGHLLAAVLVLTIVAGFGFVYIGRFDLLPMTFAFSVIIIFVHVFSQKLVGYLYDADCTHRIWGVYHYGLRPHQHFKEILPAGAIVPLFFSLFSLGLFKVPTILSYEARALKYRAARRFGYYSYSEMTDWENCLIGAAGIFSVLLVSFLAYIIGFEYLAVIAAYYAFFNLIPVSNLDGAQIFFGSRIVWGTLAFIAMIFTAYALILAPIV